MINELQNKRLLILGGNPYAEDIGRFCRDNNIISTSVSNDANAAIHKISNKAFVHDSTDLPFIAKVIKEENIDGVYMGGNEIVISNVCGLLNNLKMPCYCTPKQWAIFQNKIEFKKACIKVGLPVLKRYDYSPLSNDIISFPVITKPADACGSSGFSICSNYHELKNGYEKAKKESISGEVIVEDYVNNSGHVAFYSFSNGKAYFCQLHDKYPVQIKINGSFIAGLHIVPSKSTDEFLSLFGEKLEELFRNAGIEEGTIWIEVFHDKDKYYFNEAGFRYGGSSSIFPIDYYNHINQIAADIYYCLTGNSKLFGFQTLIPNRVLKGKKYYCMLPIHALAGRIGKIIISDALKLSQNIVEIIVKRKEGWIVPNTGDFSQNIAYVHFVYDDKDEFLSIIKLIRDSFIVLDEDNKDMLIFQNDDFFKGVRIL